MVSVNGASPWSSAPNTSSVETWWKRNAALRAGSRPPKCRRAASSNVKVPTTLVWTKSAGTVDRAVDVALGGEVHDGVRVVRLEHLAHGGGIGDVGADQEVAGVVTRVLQRFF